MAEQPNAKDGKEAKGGKGGKGDDKQAKAAMDDVGKVLGKMEKQLDKVAKLHGQADKKADKKAMKSLVDEMAELTKLMNILEKASKDLSKDI